jgi:hypothetical protein
MTREEMLQIPLNKVGILTRFVHHHPSDNMYNMDYFKRELATVKEMQEELGLPPEKIHVIKNACGGASLPNTITFVYRKE